MKDLKQVKFQDTIGKTIKGIGYDNYRCAVLYTDNTFSCVDFEFEDSYYSFEELVNYLNYTDANEPMLSSICRVFIDADIVKVEDLMTAGKEKMEIKKKERKEKLYEEYLRLKKTFEA